MGKNNEFSKVQSPSRVAWMRFRRNTVGMVSLGFVVFISLIAAIGYIITPDPTPYINRQILEISTQKPGFKVQMLKVLNNTLYNKTSLFEKMMFGKRDEAIYYPFSNFRFSNDSIYIAAFDPEPQSTPLEIGFTLADVCFAIKESSDTFTGDSVQFETADGQIIKMNITEIRAKTISDCILWTRYWLGTDQFGRDMASRLLIGARVSLAVGFISVLISLIVGIGIGALGGYFRGRVDDFVVWMINVVWSVPTLLLVIAITFALGKGFWQVFVAVGLTMWVEVARVVRGQLLSIREKEFIEAAKALGFSDMRIISRHILPNIMSPVIVISAANFASAILIEAGLSFLGLGVQPPVPSWGSMIKENYAYIILDSAYLAILPGVAIMLLVLSFMLIGNALRDALDVKIKE